MTNVARHGFWLLVDGRELFVPFARFPWFRDATVGEILKVARPAAEHLRWPDLDVDLTLDSIEHPDKYPLASKVRPVRRARSAAA